MNRNKKTENVKVNKEIKNMQFTNSFHNNKATDNREDANNANSKKK